MRKVKFKRWIAPLYISGFKQTSTGTWDADFKHDGLFHQWGCAYEEFTTGAVGFTIALVECPDGTIEAVLPSNLKFMNEEAQP